MYEHLSDLDALIIIFKLIYLVAVSVIKQI